MTISEIPFPLSGASSWVIGDDEVSITALPRSDIFVDPTGNTPATHNAATLLGEPPAGDFQFSARVEVDFNATFDAGVLLIRVDETHWGKLCFEYSPDGEPMVVSVVCRTVADDANAFVVEGRSVWLRVSRIGETFAYHASTDGRTWQMIRHFTLGVDGPVQVGFEAQAPTGPGCDVRFSEIRYSAITLADLRNGS